MAGKTDLSRNHICTTTDGLVFTIFQMAREIYSEYTDKIEPYGIDEAWLDVSDSRNLKGSGMTIAREISHRIKYELGVTVSIGISWNKIYAKLGSDYKKPDAITEFNRENYKSMIWQLPASDLLYVGRQTRKKLQKLGIRTIGELAESDEAMLESHLCYEVDKWIMERKTA